MGAPPLRQINTQDKDLTRVQSNVAAALGQMQQTQTAGGMPTGVMLAFGGDTAPDGYVLCDGAALSRKDQAALFKVIGTAFGSGNGVDTFNVPDLRGRFIRGWDDGAGRDPNASTRTAMNAGGNTGDKVGSIQAEDYLSHSHNERVPANTAGAVYGMANTSGLTQSPSTGPFTTGSSGGSETRPLNAYAAYIIKT